LSSVNSRPSSPRRRWRKSTGGPIVARISSAIRTISGDPTTNPIEATTTSKPRFNASWVWDRVASICAVEQSTAP
jgi:hypothetical protein